MTMEPTPRASEALRPERAVPPLEVEGVTKVYPGGVQALRGVTFRIATGERACLLGPNGAGKTTLIRLLTGALRPTSGTVRVFGAGVEAPEFLEAKRRMGIVPQAPGMYRDLTVTEYLALVRRLYGRGETDVVVEAFGLGPYLGRRMAELSGGWQRRLSMAAAVLSGPEVLLLDEPTVGLDPLAVREVHAFLRAMMQGRTVLLCTHNLDEAEALCDSAIMLRGGRVLLHERIETLRQRARPAVLLRAPGGLERLLAALHTLGREALPESDGVRVPVSLPERDVPVLLQALLAAGVSVYEARLLTPRLEELFVDIVGGGESGGGSAHA
jgi:ABC-2 type transport system ATP-binding protein